MRVSASIKSILFAVGVGGAVLGLYVVIDRPFEDQSAQLPRAIPVATLWASPEGYEGEMVRTSGVLRVFGPGTPQEHFAVEDEGQFRVGLRGVAADEMSPLVGQRVTVVGTFGFAEDFGVYIEVVSLAEEND